MSRFKIIILFLIINIIFFALPYIARASDLSGWAWSENIGWISFNSADSGAGGGSDYKVEIDNNGDFLGYAWSENIGWISFERSDTGDPPSDDPGNGNGQIAEAKPSGQLGNSDVYVDGWARALSYGDGWDGWIRFDHGESGEVYIDVDYVFRGWAWGGDVVGWISFNSIDPGAGGGADYDVRFNCSCDYGACGEPNCGTDTCNDDERCMMLQNCSPDGCGVPYCVFDASCYHYECDGNNECKYVAGAGADECAVDGDCAPIFWHWWEAEDW